MIFQRQADNSNKIRFYYGPGIDEPICMHKMGAGAALYYYHYDGLGSVIALSDDNGDIVERYEYDVYGAVTIYDSNGNEVAESTVGNPYMFTGRRYDDESGLYYYRARYYKAEIGRFLQTDPIGYEDGLNLYTYVRNNPIINVDPTGLDTPGCSIPGGHWGNTCWLKCCNKHDKCYTKNKCTESSWCPFSGASPECRKCNETVVECFLTNIICF